MTWESLTEIGPTIDLVVTTLLHSIWQVAIVGAVAVVAFWSLRQKRCAIDTPLAARARYAVCCAALAAMVILPIITFAALSIRRSDSARPSQRSRPEARLIADAQPGPSVARVSGAEAHKPAPSGGTQEPVDPARQSAAATEMTESNSTPASTYSADQPTRKSSLLSPFVFGAWLIGLLVVGVWRVLGIAISYRWCFLASKAPAVFIESAQRIARELRLQHVPMIAETFAVSTPVLVGFVRPVILLPIGLISQLSVREVESIIAHEIAHIRRYDQWVNLLQAAVETLLFFHPVVWWLSRRMRIEREHCTDDFVSGRFDRHLYAQALASLAEFRSQQNQLGHAVAATHGSLPHRIRRILQVTPVDSRIRRRRLFSSGFVYAALSGSACLLLIVTFLGGPAGRTVAADEPDVDPKPARSDFDLSEFDRLVNHELSVTRSEGPLVLEGKEIRTVQGQLVDHDGEPIAGAQIALMRRIGYGMYSYDQNFDKTDSLGRFILQGDPGKDRIVVRIDAERSWNAYLDRGQTEIRIEAPAPSEVVIAVDSSLAEPGTEMLIYSDQYWIGMSALRMTRTLDANGTITLDALPGTFRVAAEKTIEVHGKQQSSMVDLGRFAIGSGESKRVEIAPGADRIVEGAIANFAETRDAAGAIGAYVRISPQRTRYTDMWGASDLCACDDDGTFTTRSLDPGRYLVRMFWVYERVPERPGFGGFDPNETVYKFRFEVDEPSMGELITLPAPMESTLDFIHATLDSEPRRGVTWSHADVQAAQLQSHADRDEVVSELFRILNDDQSPQSWKVPALQALCGMTDSDGVIDGLFELMEKPHLRMSRSRIVNWLQNAQTQIDDVIDMLILICESDDNDLRSSALSALGRLVDKHPDKKEQLIPVLIRGLTDRDQRLRADTAATLGRIEAKGTEAALAELLDDPNVRAQIWAAWAIWRITGDSEDLIDVSTRCMAHDDFETRKWAAWVLQEVEVIPAKAIEQLKRLAEFKDTPPFRGHNEVMQYQASSIARRILERIDEGG